MTGRALIVSRSAAVAWVLWGLVGCSYDSAGGFGGSGGASSPDFDTRLRIAHLGPSTTSSEPNPLDFVVVGEGTFPGVVFGEVTSYGVFDPDLYTVQATPIGSPADILASLNGEFGSSERHTFIAYADSGTRTGLSLMQVAETVDDLEPERGRLIIAHGADDVLWPAFTVADTTDDSVVQSDIAFGTSGAPIDLVAGQYQLRFDAVPPDPTLQTGPISLSIEAGEAIVLVAVDGDPASAGAGVVVYVIEPDTEGLISTDD